MEKIIPIPHLDGDGAQQLIEVPTFAEREYIAGVISTELTIHWSGDQVPDTIVFNGIEFKPAGLGCKAG
jgi:hypothetical protein